MSKFGQAYKNFSSKGGIFMFLRAQLSSQMGTWVDNIVAFALKKTLDIFKTKVIYLFGHGIESYVFATVIGQICGGIFGCIMHYRWTFKTMELKFRYILLRFALVWLGSLALNTFFTYKLTELLRSQPFLVNMLKHNSDDVFIVVKLAVAVIVGVVYNYWMYRFFVYNNIDYRKLVRKLFKKRVENDSFTID